MGGNTKEVANIISQTIRDENISVLISDLDENIDIEEYSLVFIGSYTWGNGNLPQRVREYLKWLLKENSFNLPTFSVYGTGDTQWTHFCRAVDELEYHLNKKANVIGKLKIEQHPVNQLEKVVAYTKSIIKEVLY